MVATIRKAAIPGHATGITREENSAKLPEAGKPATKINPAVSPL